MTDKNSALIPFSDLQQMAVALGKGTMFGKSADQLLPLMLIAQAQGRHPATVAMDYDVINGKPAINSRATLSRFQLSGGRVDWADVADKSKECTATFSHPQGGSITITWTMDRATKAGLTGKSTWKQYPDQMLRARCIAEGVRATFPACLDGLYTVEEVQDFGKTENKGWKREPKMDAQPEQFTDAEIVDNVTELDEDGSGVVQVSEAFNSLRKMLIDHSIDYTAFEKFLRAKGKVAPKTPMSTMSEEMADQIIEHFAATIDAFKKWSAE